MDENGVFLWSNMSGELKASKGKIFLSFFDNLSTMFFIQLVVLKIEKLIKAKITVRPCVFVKPCTKLNKYNKNVFLFQFILLTI